MIFFLFFLSFHHHVSLGGPVDPVRFAARMRVLDSQLASTLLNDMQNKRFVDSKLKAIEAEKRRLKPLNGRAIADEPSNYTGPYAKNYYEGDILLTTEQLDYILPQALPRPRRQAAKTSRYPFDIWINGAIPYSFDPKFPEDREQPVREAIKFWEKNTCIRFRENGTGSARIRFINGYGCYSSIGKLGYEQVVSIGSGCDWIGTIAHELAHAFGIWHTQSRYDRGNYVTLNAWNVQKHQMYNFNTQSRQYTDLYGVPYEFGSVMHYSENDFAYYSSQPTLIAKTGYERFQHSMNNYLPTTYDIHLINSYYKCYDQCKVKPECKNGGKPDVNRCGRCRCPPGFAGIFCESIAACGCDRVMFIDSTPVQFMAAAGWGNLNSITYNECNIHLVAPEGKRIQLNTNSSSGYSSWNCFGAGADIRIAADPAMSGVRLCRPNTQFTPLYSDTNRLVIHLFARLNYVNFSFSAKSFS